MAALSLNIPGLSTNIPNTVQFGGSSQGGPSLGSSVSNGGLSLSNNPNNADLSNAFVGGGGGVNPPTTVTKTVTAPPVQAAPAPKLPDRSADISQQNAALAQVDPMQTGGINAIHEALAKLNAGYDTQAADHQTNYDTQSDTNKSNLLRNQQTAYVNASQGRRGLLSTLASLGALSGSGVDLANRAVQQGANTDLANAGDAFSGNANQLKENMLNFTNADKARRLQNNNEVDDAVTGIKNQALLNRQKIYGALANDYEQQGDKVNQAKYTGMANDLFPGITSTSIPSSNLTAGAAAYTPMTLSNYINGANSQVTTTPGSAGQLPGLMANLVDRRKSA